MPALRAAGLTHRDLKPRNIFLAQVGDSCIAKVGDYGLAKAFDLALIDNPEIHFKNAAFKRALESVV